jgi:hypothetical protein
MQRGEIATQKDFLKQGPVVTSNDNGKKTLSDIGISRNESSTFQTIKKPGPHRARAYYYIIINTLNSILHPEANVI